MSRERVEETRGSGGRVKKRCASDGRQRRRVGDEGLGRRRGRRKRGIDKNSPEDKLRREMR